MTPDKLKQANEQLEALLDLGVIVPSKSPWASAIVMVKKKGGQLRMCIDFRHLNDVTIKDAFPLPRMDDSIASLGSARYFSSVDVSNAFWQIPLRRQDQYKTAFIHPLGLFHWTRMPFGLCNATATFQRLMTKALGHLIKKYGSVVLCYVDDILIATYDADDHLTRLEEVFTALKRAGLKLKPQKCDLFKKEVKFLGRIIDANGVRPDPEQAKIVKEWPPPTNKKQLESFLGLASYYRDFIKGFAQIAEPLQKMKRNRAIFIWGEEQQTAFEELRDKLVNAPILGLPLETGRYFLDTDASEVALAGILHQEQIIDGKLKKVVIAYGSYALSTTERRYGAPKKELLAMYYFIKKFQCYLARDDFTLRTDNAALKFLKTYSMDLNMIGRWIQYLSQFKFTIEHRKRNFNQNADGISKATQFYNNMEERPKYLPRFEF